MNDTSASRHGSAERDLDQAAHRQLVARQVAGQKIVALGRAQRPVEGLAVEDDVAVAHRQDAGGTDVRHRREAFEGLDQRAAFTDFVSCRAVY